MFPSFYSEEWKNIYVFIYKIYKYILCDLSIIYIYKTHLTGFMGVDKI